MTFKICPRCKKEKSKDEYYRRQDASYLKQTYCIDCMKSYNKERYAKYKKRKNAWF